MSPTKLCIVNMKNIRFNIKKLNIKKYSTETNKKIAKGGFIVLSGLAFTGTAFYIINKTNNVEIENLKLRTRIKGIEETMLNIQTENVKLQTKMKEIEETLVNTQNEFTKLLETERIISKIVNNLKKNFSDVNKIENAKTELTKIFESADFQESFKDFLVSICKETKLKSFINQIFDENVVKVFEKNMTKITDTDTQIVKLYLNQQQIADHINSSHITTGIFYVFAFSFFLIFSFIKKR